MARALPLVGLLLNSLLVAQEPGSTEAQLKTEVARNRAQGETSVGYVEALQRLASYYLRQTRLRDAESTIDQASLTGKQIFSLLPPVTRAEVSIAAGDLYHAMARQEGASPSWDQLAAARYFGADGGLRVLAVLDEIDLSPSKPLSVIPAWRKEALRYLPAWRFDPMRKDGQPVSSVAFLEVDSKLQD